MRAIHSTAVLSVLAMFAVESRAAEDVLVAGDPPLTRSLVDQKIAFWGWVLGQDIDDKRRGELRRIEAAEWGRRDGHWKARWVQLLKTWRTSVAAGEANRLQGIRATALNSLGRADADAMGTSLLATATLTPPPPLTPGGQGRNFDAIQMQVLQKRQAERDQFLRMLSEARHRQHETMMTIIRNMGPSGRYEYNPSTGKYDRYVPYR